MQSSGESPPGGTRLAYRPELDGIRAVAILLVIATHSFILAPNLRGDVVEGGFMGVDVFFVLSGFLITSLLVAEYDTTGRVAIGSFYARRAVRLLPALVAVLAVSWVYAVVADYPADWGSNAATLSTLWHAITYTSNFHAYISPLATGDLGHLWSLALEAQFYLVWAPVLLVLLRWRRTRRALPAVIAAAVVLVAANRLRVYETDGWLAAYHRSDTRIDGLLVGAMAAVLRSRGMVPWSRVRRAVPLAAAVAIVCVLVLRGNRAPAYYGGLLAMNLAVAVLLLAALDGGWGRRVLAWRPAVILGRVSYGVYLWHFPVFWAVSRWMPTGLGPLPWLVGVVVAAVPVAASWYLVEQPAARWYRRYVGRASQRAADRASVRAWATTPEGAVHLAARRRFVRWTGAAAAASTALYVGVLFDFGWRPWRTAVPEGYFSAMYDVQARAMMQGHFWVPRGSLSIEGFIHAGKEYTYFPPWPSLVRMPFMMASDRFDGRLTALSMLAAWCVALAAGLALLWHIRVLVRGRVALGRAEAALWAAVVIASFGGSTWLYLAALPWAYHEAFAWGAAGALASLYALLKVIERPSRRRVLLLGGCLLAAVWSRTTTGWGCAFGVLIVAGWFLTSKDHRRRWWLPVLFAAVVPVLAGSAVTYAKFRTLWMHPLGSQVWTELNEHRRQALAENGGSLTGVQFLASNVRAYFWPTSVAWSRTVPFVDLPAEPPPLIGYGGAFFDQTYRTASIPPTMPLSLLLAGVGLSTLALGRRRAALRALAPPMVGAAVGTVGVLCYGYIGQRYVHDFVPFLTVAAGAGAAVVAEMVAGRRRRRIGVAAGAVLLASYSTVAFASISWWTIRVSTGGPALAAAVQDRLRLADLGGDAPRATVAEALPRTSRPGDLVVAPDCRAVYLGLAERFEPWVTVDMTPLVFDVEVTGRSRPPVRVAELVNEMSVYLTVETDARGAARVAIEIPYLPTPGPWLSTSRSVHRVEVTPDRYLHFLEVRADGRFVGMIPTGNYDGEAFRHQAWPRLRPPGTSTVNVREVATAPSAFCRTVRSAAR